MTGANAFHGLTLTIGGRDHRIGGTFRMALAIEEQIGKIMDVAQQVMDGDIAVQAAVLSAAIPDVTAAEIEAHFDEVGIGGVRTEAAAIMAMMLRGWRAVSKEAEASGAVPGPLGRKGPGRPRGAKNRTKDGFLGAISSGEPASSASAPAISGKSPPPSSPPSGPPSGPDTLQNGHCPQSMAEPMRSELSQPSGVFPGTE
jgi:hypothetical protein